MPFGLLVIIDAGRTFLQHKVGVVEAKESNVVIRISCGSEF